MLLTRNATYRFDDFEVDLGARILRRGDRPVEIARESFDLLALLIARAPRAMSEAELTAALWPRAEVEESNLGQHIFLLRRALTGTTRGEKVIAAAPGGGYRFAAELTEVAAEPRQDTEGDAAIRSEPFSHERMSRESMSHEPMTHESMSHEPMTHESMTHEPMAHGTMSDAPVFVSLRARTRTEQAKAPRLRERRPHAATEETATEPEAKPSLWTKVRSAKGLWIAAAAVAVLVVGAVLALVVARMRARPAASMRLVVADFANTTGDPEFDGSLRAALVSELRQSPYLILPGEDKVVGALVAMNTGADSGDAEAAKPRGIPQELCQRLKSEAYVRGEIRRLGAKYLIALEGMDCAHGAELASVRGVADTPDHVLPILHRMAAVVRGELGEPKTSVQRFNQPLFPEGGASMAALKAYADGVGLALDGKSSEAIGMLQRAVGIDSQFATAYEQLGLVTFGLAATDPAERAAADTSLTRAFQLRNHSSAFDRFNITARYEYLTMGDYAAGVRNFNEAIESYPHSPVFLSGLADLENRLGRPALALDPARRSVGLEPDNVTGYEVLAEAQMHLGQMEEAALTCRRAISREIDSAKIHSLLLQIAFLRLDQPGIDEQLAWAHGRLEEPEIEAEQGRMELAQGRVKSAQARFAHAAASFRSQGRAEQANALLSGLPRRYEELGLSDLADTQIGRLPQDSDAADLAVARAELGGTEHAGAMLKQALSAHPASTEWQMILGPQIRAAIALNEHETEVALTALEPALPYDLASFDLPAMRGRAYMQAHQPQQAEAEFHKILDHPGIDPLSQDYPLAQLGLARALVAEGKSVEAGYAYKIVLQIWKDADSDLPRLQDAKAEYARLNGAPARPSSAAAKSRRR